MKSLLSDQPEDKLLAAVHHDRLDPDNDLGEGYRDACAEWFAALSKRHKSLAATAREAYEAGDLATAEEIAAKLPTAPVFPLE